MVKFNLESGNGNGRLARISRNGELTVRALEYSETSFQNMAVDDQAYNFYEPIVGTRFVITGIVADADRNVGVNGASVIVYEAISATTITIAKTLFQFDMAKQTSKVLLPLNTQTNPGVFINAKMDDNNVLMTIMGYFINV